MRRKTKPKCPCCGCLLETKTVEPQMQKVFYCLNRDCRRQYVVADAEKEAEECQT